MTAAEWLIEKMLDSGIGICKEWRQQAKEMEMQNAIGFHKWMKREDHVINSEKYFHFSDKDMYNEYLKQSR